MKNYIFLLQFPKILPKSETMADCSTNAGFSNSAQRKQSNTMLGNFSVKPVSFTMPQSPLNGKSRSSTPSEAKAASSLSASSSSPSISGNTISGMKPLRPYGATASPHEVANAAKMLKRIEDMKGKILTKMEKRTHVDNLPCPGVCI